MNETFPEFVHLAATLNEKTDNINALIESLNKKLSSLNIGIEVWLDDTSIDDGELYPVPDEQDCAVFYADSVVLGYCRVGEKWQLALKTLTYGEMGSEDEGPSYKSGSKRALLSASRSDRIKAMKLLPKLLERIKDEVSDTIQAIDDAARAVGNL